MKKIFLLILSLVLVIVLAGCKKTTISIEEKYLIGVMEERKIAFQTTPKESASRIVLKKDENESVAEVSLENNQLVVKGKEKGTRIVSLLVNKKKLAEVTLEVVDNVLLTTKDQAKALNDKIANSENKLQKDIFNSSNETTFAHLDMIVNQLVAVGDNPFTGYTQAEIQKIIGDLIFYHKYKEAANKLTDGELKTSILGQIEKFKEAYMRLSIPLQNVFSEVFTKGVDLTVLKDGFRNLVEAYQELKEANLEVKNLKHDFNEFTVQSLDTFESLESFLKTKEEVEQKLKAFETRFEKAKNRLVAVGERYKTELKTIDVFDEVLTLSSVKTIVDIHTNDDKLLQMENDIKTVNKYLPPVVKDFAKAYKDTPNNKKEPFMVFLIKLMIVNGEISEKTEKLSQFIEKSVSKETLKRELKLIADSNERTILPLNSQGDKNTYLKLRESNYNPSDFVKITFKAVCPICGIGSGPIKTIKIPDIYIYKNSSLSFLDTYMFPDLVMKLSLFSPAYHYNFKGVYKGINLVTKDTVFTEDTELELYYEQGEAAENSELTHFINVNLYKKTPTDELVVIETFSLPKASIKTYESMFQYGLFVKDGKYYTGDGFETYSSKLLVDYLKLIKDLKSFEN